MKKSKVLVLLVIIGIIFIGIVSWSQRRQPKPLVFAATPDESTEATHEHWVPLMEYLSRVTGREWRLHIVSDYTTAVIALDKGWADMVHLGAASFGLAHEEMEGNLVAIAAYADARDGKSIYWARIWTRADSGIESIEDLQGASFAFADPGSTSGYKVPSEYLASQSVTLGEEFFAGSHQTAIVAVWSGTCDAGAASSRRIEEAVREEVVDGSMVNILWSSPPIPSGPMCVRADMPEELRLKIRQALIDCPARIIWTYNPKVFGFTEMSNDDYADYMP